MLYTVFSVTVTSVAIGIIYIFFLRSFDIYEKDHWFKLFISFLAGGLISIFFAGVIYQFLNVENNMADAILKIGLTEESAKLAAFFVIFIIFGKDIDEPVDGILYMSAIALGFACIESISYALSSETPYLILFLRAFVSVVGHITFTGYMGIALYIHLKIRRNYTGLALSLTLASLAHGLYDGLLFHPELNFIFKYLFIAVIIFHFYMVRIALSYSTFRKRFSPDLFEENGASQLSNCVACNQSNTNRELSFWKVHPQLCSHCSNIIFSNYSFKMLMRYFRPVLRQARFRKRLAGNSDKTGISYIGGYSDMVYSPANGSFSMNPESLTEWIRKSYAEDRVNALNKPVTGFILRYIGFRYIQEKL